MSKGKQTSSNRPPASLRRQPLTDSAPSFDRSALELIAVLPVLISYIDKDLRYAFVNQTYAEWFGRPIEDIVGKRLDEILGKAAVKRLRPHLDKALAGAHETFELDVPYSVAGHRSIQADYIPDLGPDGIVQGIFALVRDISERKRAEAASLAERHLAAIVESSEDAIVSKDLTGKILSWNRAAERMFGFTEAEAVGQSITILIPKERLSEEDLILSKIVRGESLESFETVRHRRDGTRIDISLTVSPIRDVDGKVIGASKIARDITEQKRAENELQEQQMLLSMAMESSRMGAWEHDWNSDLVYWSSALEELFGLEPGTFPGTRAAFYELIHDGDRDRVWSEVERAVSNHESYRVEFRFHHADGSLRWMEGRGRAMYSDAGEPVRLYGIGLDITDRIRAEADASLLAEISELIRKVDDPISLLGSVAAAVGRHLGAKRCLFNEIDLANDLEIVHTDYHAGADSVAGIHKISDYSPVTSAEIAAGKTIVNRDSRVDQRTAEFFEKTYGPAGERAYVAVPLLRDGVWVASLWVSDDAPRDWTADEVALLETVAERTWSTIERLRIETALRASERQFARFMQHLPGLAWIKDREGRYLYANEAAVRAFGRPREEIIGRTDREIFPPDIADAFVLNDEQAAKSAVGLQAVESLFDPEDGRVRHSIVSKFIIGEPDETDVMVGGVAVDITDRLVLERELAEQAKVLEAVTLDAPLQEVLDITTSAVESQLPGAAAAIMLADEAEELLYTGSARSLPSAYTAEIEGLAISEGIGSCGTSAFRRTPVFVSDAQSDPLWASFRELAVRHDIRACWSNPIFSSTGKLLGTFAIYFPGVRSPYPSEERLLFSMARLAGLAIERSRTRDAITFAERRAASDYRALLQRIVPLAQTLGTARDLPTIYRAVQGFICSSMNCSAFFVSFFDEATRMRRAAYAWGTEGEVDVALLPPIQLTENGGPNSQAVFQKRAIVVNNYMEMMRAHAHIIAQEDGVDPQSSLAVPMMSMDRVIGTFEVQSYENDAFGPEQVTAMEMVANLAAVAIENVRLIEYEAKARREAEAANRTKDEFLSVLSHELRTPLNSMLGWVRMLRTGMLDEAQSKKAFEVIERNTRQQGSLIEDLLDVSRIISGKMLIEKELVNFASVVHEVCDALRPLAAAKKIALTEHLSDRVIYVEGDPVRLQQCVSNLVQNAVKFTPAEGRVDVSLKRSREFATLSVADTGIGIDPEFLPHIFDRFRQADASANRVYAGLGLGLTIVHTIAQLHNGSIDAESAGVGRGSTFNVRLPLAQDYYRLNGSETPDSPRRLSMSAELDGLRLLLVDDDPESLVPVRIFLENQNAEVSIATSADEALERLAERSFDMLITDIGMPKTDGYEFLSELRQDGTGPNSEIPAVAITAYASPDDRKRTLAAGFRAHMGKPLNFEELLAVIKTIRDDPR